MSEVNEPNNHMNRMHKCQLFDLHNIVVVEERATSSGTYVLGTYREVRYG